MADAADATPPIRCDGDRTRALLPCCGPTSSTLAEETWQSRQVPLGGKPSDALFGISCPTASLCVAVGGRGAIVTSTDPNGGGAAWASETVAPGAYVGTATGAPDRTSPGTFRSVFCPIAGMCAAVTYAGDLHASADPAGRASTWRATDLDGDEGDRDRRPERTRGQGQIRDPTTRVGLLTGSRR